jgi:hypothetical protein
VLSGDINLLRSSVEKSIGVINQNLVDLFNNFISDMDVKETHRVGSNFTWINKQENPH